MKSLTGAQVSCLRVASILLALFALSLPVAAQDSQKQVHVDAEVFADAIRSFHKLLNAIDIGVSYVDYRRMLVDTKTDLDAPLAKFPKSSQRDDLDEAMRDFVIASDVWQFAIENAAWCANRYQEGGMPTKNDFYRGLRQRYGEKLPPPKTGQCNVRYETLLHLIWANAAVRIEHAIQLQKETDGP